MKNVLFLIYEGYPGVATVLRNIRKHLIENFSDKCTVKSANIDAGKVPSFPFLQEVRSNKHDILMIGGWDQTTKTLVENFSNAGKKKIILQWCSPITQSEMSVETVRFMEVINFLKRRVISNVSVLLESDYLGLRDIDDNFIYMPPIVDFEEMDKIETPQMMDDSGLLNVDMFCAPCARKNLMAQTVSLSYRKDIKLHTNYNEKTAPHYINFMKVLFNGKYTNYGWLERAKYLGLAKSMDFASQVSLSESFNYTAVEHMHYGVPVLLSRATPLAKYKEIEDLVVSNNNDVMEIREKINKLMNIGFRMEIGEECKVVAEKINKTNTDLLNESLEKILGED